MLHSVMIACLSVIQNKNKIHDSSEFTNPSSGSFNFCSNLIDESRKMNSSAFSQDIKWPILRF